MLRTVWGRHSCLQPAIQPAPRRVEAERLISTLIVLALLAPPILLAQSSADAVKKGKSVFTSKCQKCHGPGAKGDGPDSDPKSPAADLTDEFRYELNPEGILYYKVLNGHPPQMPAFKSQLAPDEVWQVVAYVMSLRKPQ